MKGKITMEEKVIEKKEEQPIEPKKVYTPPMLTVYGKLTELTAGGSQPDTENNPHPTRTPRS
jgi:hypothetical protein